MTYLYDFKPVWADTFGAKIHPKALRKAVAHHIDAHKGLVRLVEEGGKTGPWRSHFVAKHRFARRILKQGQSTDKFKLLWKDSPQAHTEIQVIKEPDKSDLLIAICERHIGLRYRLGWLSWLFGTDCSGMTSLAVKEATGGAVNLPHHAADQMFLVHRITLAQAQVGDLMFFHNGAHVAVLHHRTTDGHYFVIDEEPGAEPGVPSGWITGGLHVRPGYPGYYVGPENIDTCGRITQINGPVT